MEILKNIFGSYSYFYFLGISFYLLTTPKLYQNKILSVILPPIFGLSLISIVSVYIINSNISIKYTTIISFAISSLILLIYIGLNIRNNFGTSIFKIIPFKAPLTFFLIVFGLLALCSLVFFAGISDNTTTTPWRIGIDQAGYIETARFLLEGGTRDKIFHTGVYNSLFYMASQIDLEYLTRALRWAVPATIAVTTDVFNLQHPFQITFIIIAWCHIFTAGVGLFFLRTRLNLIWPLSLLGSACLVYNCNLLFLLHEGMYAQVFVLPSFFLFLIIFFDLRRTPVLQTRQETLKLLFLMAFLFAGAFSAFNEIFLVFFFFLAICNGFDLFFNRKLYIRALTLINLAFILGFLIVLPYSIHWLQFTIKHIGALAGAGFPQPYWASVSEILGVFNIYDRFIDWYNVAPTPIVRTPVNQNLVRLTSALFFGLFFYSIIKNRKLLDVPFFLSTPFAIILVYVYLRTMGLTNYSYMKVYTCFLPVLFCTFFYCLYLLKNNLGSLFKFHLISIIFSLSVICSGATFITSYKDSSRFLSKNALDLYLDFKKGKFYGTIILPKKRDSGKGWLNSNGLFDRLTENMFYSILPVAWIDQWQGRDYNLHKLNYLEVVFLIDKIEQPDKICLNDAHSKNLIYENNQFLLIKSGLTAKEAFPENIPLLSHIEALWKLEKELQCINHKGS